MLENNYTLSIDVANNSTLVDVDYTRYDQYNNRSVYVSENHVPGAEEKLTFYRTFPTSVGNFKGVRKTAFKFAWTCEVPGNDGTTVQSSNIAEVSFSLPVGVSSADAMKIRQAVITLLDNDTIMVPLHEQQNV